jgi:hypothetical protein
MNKDEIIRMAQSAGVSWSLGIGGMEDFLERFAALVAAREREACAEICDRFQARDVGMQPAECAGAIRARGNNDKPV